MDTRTIGTTPVGAIGLGCMGMSWAYGQADDAESARVIHRALDLGCTLLDTSDVYGPHTNERLVGAALAGRRDEAFLATKAGLYVEEGGGARDIKRNGRPEHLSAAIDASLERLGTDHVELWYLHRVDPDVPIEESWGAMAAAVAAGKVGALGLSEVDPATAARAHAVHPVAAIQSELSVWTRDAITGGVVGWCAQNGAAFVPFSPLGRGFLTGRISAEEEFSADDFRAGNPRFTSEARTANGRITDAIRAVAAAHDAAPGQVAIAWVLAQGEHVVPIPGTKRLSYLEENLGTAALSLTAEELATLDGLPAPSGARY